MKVTIPLWAHQQRLHDFAVQQFHERGYCWWLSGCATGKTLTSIKLIETFGFDRILVLTAKSPMTQIWKDEPASKTDGLNVLVLTGGTAKTKAAHMRAELQKVQPLMVVVNYETARMIADDIAQADFQYVIADESHKLKTHNSKQSKELAKACARIPYRLAMTGTAWDDRPTDVFGQVRFLDSRIFRSWHTFFDQFVRYYETPERVKIATGYKNLDQLAAKIDPFTIYLNSEEVLSLPAQIDIERPVELTPALRTAYRQMQRDMVAYIGDDLMLADNLLTQSLRLHMLTSGFYVPYEMNEIGQQKSFSRPVEIPDGDVKLQETLQILDEIGRHPVVIFTRFKADVQRLYDALHRSYDVKLLTGERKEHVAFQNGHGDILIANIQAGNAGVNLNRARYCIYYSIGYSRTDYQQSRYRVRRPGSEQPVTYYHIVAKQTVDVLMRQLMQEKEDNATTILRGITNPL